MEYESFKQFMSAAYYHKKRYVKRIRSLYGQIDQNGNGCVSLNEFFDLIDIVEQNPYYQLPLLPDFWWWVATRNFLNRKLKLKKIAKNVIFEVFMFIVLIVNCVVLIMAQMETDEEKLNTLYTIDNICLYIYIVECAIKAIGLGLEKYWEDGWNRFDFYMIIMSLAIDFVFKMLTFLKSVRTAKASKLIRITKANRVFRMFRACRSVKIFNCCVVAADILYEVKLLIERIFTCFPLILKLTPIIFMAFYFYSCIGVEIFNSHDYEIKEGSPYDVHYLNQFNDFGKAMLTLLQIMIEQNWVNISYDIAFKFNNYTGSVLYFVSFHIIIALILGSLIKGIVWEVFMVIEKTHKAKEEKVIKTQATQEKKLNKMSSLKIVDKDPTK